MLSIILPSTPPRRKACPWLLPWARFSTLPPVPAQRALVDRRVVFISVLSILIAAIAAFVAQGLILLIQTITDVAFFGRLSFGPISPAANHLGPWVIAVPVLGGLIVGAMARYGSEAIRGHGIPEAMEQILTNESRIRPRLTFLKPLSAAIAIGTGGPFGAEGPIIATGGAVGSVVGQVLRTTAAERKTLLAAGAAAGMAATFGSPVSAVLLAIELLLFEFRPRSLIPVALASATAAGVRIAFLSVAPMFPMPTLSAPSGWAMACYIALGATVGFFSVLVTKLVYLIEELFERLPVHWMWWPAIGAMAVGIVGFLVPRTLGVGYGNITDIISNHVPTLSFVAVLALMKLVSWSIVLGSGTSGGTLAPLFTIGSGIGAVLGAAAIGAFPHVGIDIRIAALVGMAAMFAGASRALLASVVFAFETTLQPLGLLPLLGGCTAAFLVSALLMRYTIMTEKIVRRGIRVPEEYAADYLANVLVRDAMSSSPVTFKADQTLDGVRQWIAARAPGSGHQGFPLVDAEGHVVGVLTRRDLLDTAHPARARLHDLIQRFPIVIYDANSGRLIGMLTRSDVLSAHRRRLRELTEAERVLALRSFLPRWPGHRAAG